VNTTVHHAARRQAVVAPTAVALVALLAAVVVLLAGRSGGNAAGVSSGPASPTSSSSTSGVAASSIPAADDRDASAVRVELVAGDKIAIAILDETPEARAFAAMLPITVDMEDPFGQAKTGRLPGALDIEDATRSRSYAAGDLSYWSPSRSLAVVYDALGRSVPPPGLVRLGRVQTGLETVAKAGNDFAMTIRHAPKEDH